MINNLCVNDMQYREEDIPTNALELLASTSQWILTRHQWLIDNMRCLLMGESAPTLDELYEFDFITARTLNLPKNLIVSFVEIRSQLEDLWREVIKTYHPLSGLTLFEQVNMFHKAANAFMQGTKEANQRLWFEFSLRDTLTGAWTRLSLSGSLSQELARADRQNVPACIAILDQNQFKQINDIWGHVVGDDVLSKTAEIISKNLRPNDKLFRYGGDEWLILMPSTNKAVCIGVIERIQEVCGAHVFVSPTGIKFCSTFTFGVSESVGGQTAEEWIAAADAKFYDKKRELSASLQLEEHKQ